ncbi:MAG: DUF4276 family protein [Candidatus Aegiribacteria sp.]|nr:DUF4276 family protein [Candidatus Aegiribacteria sp.]
MNKSAEIIAIVEGKTEQIFIQSMVSPYLYTKGVYITPIIASKPGQKGGDIKFSRIRKDIELHLKQRSDTYLTLFLDYYGLKRDWPGYLESREKRTSIEKANVINFATMDAAKKMFGEYVTGKRFVPYISIHEFEALLFSDPSVLSSHLNVSESQVTDIVTACGSPEEINDSQQTAPSKRLLNLSKRFKKTTTGITVANEIGLKKIRECCPIFNEWLTVIESIGEG